VVAATTLSASPRASRTVASPACRYAHIMICLPPQGNPPHTAADMAHSAHSQHCGHTALPPGQKTNPRRRADPTQTDYAHPFICTIRMFGCILFTRGSCVSQLCCTAYFPRASRVNPRCAYSLFLVHYIHRRFIVKGDTSTHAQGTDLGGAIHITQCKFLGFTRP